MQIIWSRNLREKTMRRTHILLGILVAGIFALAPSAHAQDAPKWEIFGGYTYMRANIVVSGTQFNMNGGSGSVAYNLNNWFGLVGDFGITHSGTTGTQPFSLNIYTYEFGPRVSWRNHTKLTPYGQVLIGGGHANGTLYTSSLGSGLAPLGASNDFNFTAGGGVDWKINHGFSVRLAQAEYLHTQFPNAHDNSQSNFRLSTGVVFSFGQR
jgi:outer membrane immunogenic protein